MKVKWMTVPESAHMQVLGRAPRVPAFQQRIMSPFTPAEKTIAYFLFGKRPGYFPESINCRCVLVPIIEEVKP